MNEMLLMALDPGGSTGWCFATRSDTGWSDIIYGTLDTAEHHDALWDMLDKIRPDVIVCENFNYRRNDIDKGVSVELVSREYIGIVKLWCRKNRVSFVLQQPPDMALWSDDMLRRAGLWIPGKGNRHARDAMRHFLFFVTTTMVDLTFVRKTRR